MNITQQAFLLFAGWFFFLEGIVYKFTVNFNFNVAIFVIVTSSMYLILKRSLWKKNYYNSDAIIMRGEREWYVLHGCGSSRRAIIIFFLYSHIYTLARSPSDTLFTPN